MIFSDAARRAEAHLPATFAFLQDLVSINSFTTNLAGVRSVAERIGRQFDEMGFTSALFDNADPGLGSHHVARRESPNATRSIALVSHLDTVFTPEEEHAPNFHFRREGRRIYGPGANDIKGGTALIWLTLRLIRELAPAEFEKTNWFVLHNACEEVISTDFAKVCRTVLPANTLACLVFEADGGSDTGF
jgi:acetylornithine deacetylase/succinyl-diaminopimelate desuccinylase-like protein